MKYLHKLMDLLGYVPKRNVEAITARYPAVCNTVSGACVDLLNPSPETLHLEDIAHALANNARYAGHTVVHYSVGQHSVLMASHIYKDTGDAQLALAGLLHDSPEAYLTDIPAPFKKLLIGYGELEEKMEQAIADKFGLTPELFARVKPWDLKIVGDEMRCLLPNYVGDNRATLDMDIVAWSPAETKRRFLDMFFVLTGLQASEA